MKLYQTVIGIFIIALTALTANADQIRVATWNIEHLRDADNEGPNKRTDEDYNRLMGYADRLDADIIALQEVEGASAAKRVFASDKYNHFFSSRNNVQLTGFAVKKHLQVVQNSDYDELNVSGGLRYGTDITVTVSGKKIRFLAVHLKSGCFSKPLTPGNTSCGKLQEQVPVLEEWIDARAGDEMPFIVLGDFNRRFNLPGDSFWSEIDDSQPANADLFKVTEGEKSQCWGGQYPEYIDHIVLDKITTGWLVNDSFKQLVFTEDTSFRDVLSDHCPISVMIDTESTGSGSQQAESGSEETVYHGNVRSKKYHAPGCQAYNCQNCTAEFQTKQAAESAGFSPCGSCKP